MKEEDFYERSLGTRLLFRVANLVLWDRGSGIVVVLISPLEPIYIMNVSTSWNKTAAAYVFAEPVAVSWKTAITV